MILSDVREHLYRTVVPHINDEGNVQRFNQYLNEAQERFINSGKWKGTYKEIEMPATDDFITLPPRFVSCMAVRYSSEGGGALVDIRNQWFKYKAGGSHIWTTKEASDAGYITLLTDIGDGYCTFADSPFTQYVLKVTREDAGDNNLKLLIKGYAPNGDAIISEDDDTRIEGIIVVLDANEVTTTQVFKGPLAFVQKQPSQGFVKIEAVNNLTGESLVIGRYMPGETVANYRRYSTGGKAKDTQTVNAICKLRYLPCKVDTDEVFPSNLGALKNGLAALKYEDEGDKDAYNKFFTDGIKLLNDEAREARGGAKFTLNVDPEAFQFHKLYPGR